MGATVLRPSQRFGWDLFVLLLVLYNALEVPFVVAFQPRSPLGLVAFDYLVDFFFLIDLLLNFHTAYFERDRRLVMDRRMIAYTYLRTWFAVDLISIVPFELILGALTGGSIGSTVESAFSSVETDGGSSLQILSIVKCIRLIRLHRVIKMVNQMQFGNLFGIVRLYAMILLLCHWLACLWYPIVSIPDRVSRGEIVDSSWASTSGIRGFVFDEDTQEWTQGERNLGHDYLVSFLIVALLLFRTQRYPTVHPIEEVFVLLTVLLGAAVQATVFGQIAHLISTMNRGQSAFEGRLKDITERMRYHRVPGELQHRIVDFYEAQWERHRLSVGERDPVAWASGLSESLNKELLLFLHRDMILRVRMFRHVGANVILQVVSCLTSHLFLPGDYVVRAGEEGTCMYFIRKGECRVLLRLARDSTLESNTSGESTGPRVPKLATKRLREGDHFGEISLLFATKRTATIVASTYSDLSALKASDFDRIVEANEEFALSLWNEFQFLLSTSAEDGLDSKLAPREATAHATAHAARNSLPAPAQTQSEADSAAREVRRNGNGFGGAEGTADSSFVPPVLDLRPPARVEDGGLPASPGEHGLRRKSSLGQIIAAVKAPPKRSPTGTARDFAAASPGLGFTSTALAPTAESPTRRKENRGVRASTSTSDTSSSSDPSSTDEHKGRPRRSTRLSGRGGSDKGRGSDDPHDADVEDVKDEKGSRLRRVRNSILAAVRLTSPPVTARSFARGTTPGGAGAGGAGAGAGATRASVSGWEPSEAARVAASEAPGVVTREPSTRVIRLDRKSLSRSRSGLERSTENLVQLGALAESRGFVVRPAILATLMKSHNEETGERTAVSSSEFMRSAKPPAFFVPR